MSTTPTTAPVHSVRALRSMVASADHLATRAGMDVLALGGNAVDAAIATNAAIAVTAPHLCGLGGDLFALVHDARGDQPVVHALDASGRAGSGADSAALRAEGHRAMPFRHDIRTVTVPGCVDGWSALHARFGTLPLAQVLAPAIDLADEGFPASPLLVAALLGLDEQARPAFADLLTQARRPGDRVRRPGVAGALRDIAAGGRDAFYQGGFGEGLLRMGDGLFSPTDLAAPNADWVAPLRARAFGVDLVTMPPSSQGYLLLGSAALADTVGAASNVDDVTTTHLLIECAKAAGFDRPDVLSETADGEALLERIASRSGRIAADRAADLTVRAHDGDTTYLAVVDGDLAVSLIQSNASGFGSWLVEPTTGINLHNRGLGFELRSGHPAEFGPRRRPPHTLSPALALMPDGALRAVFGTMGGDAQPQILLQLAARLFAAGMSPAQALAAPRWVLHGPTSGFDTWTSPGGPGVRLEAHADDRLADGLRELGHRVSRVPAFDSTFGHAHAIVVDRERSVLLAAADPRAVVGAAAGR